MTTPLQFLQILIKLIENREVARLTALWLHKHTTVIATLEVALALHGSIILARWLVKRDADPSSYSWNLRDKTGVADCASSRIGCGEEAHSAANYKTWERVSCCFPAKRYM